MSEELARGLAEAKAVFRQKWAESVQKNQYTFEVARFDNEVRSRHLKLWEQLIKAFQTGDHQPYLALVEKEGRLQARANSRVESLLIQFSEIMNLVWDVVCTSPTIEANPVLLRQLTQQLNNVRQQASAAILNGFTEETQLIQQEQTEESSVKRRLRLEQTSLPDLIKSVSAFRISRCHPGQLIFQPGDERSILYFILSGRVRIYELLPDGRAISLSILNDSDVFSQSTNHNSYFHDVYAESMTEGLVASIRESALEDLMRDSPLLAARIIDSFSHQLSQSQNLIRGLLGRDVSVRVASLLLKLAEEFGTVRPGGAINIELGLTHQELADMIGSNRVTVTRKLLELQEKKLISVEKRTISIVNKSVLEQMAA